MLNFVTVGRNFIVDKFMAAANQVDGISFYGAYSRSCDDGLAFAKKYGADKVFTDLDALCNDENVDFVYVANPNKFHKEFSVKLLSAKKHVLCEKPAATNARDFKEMMACAEKNGVVLMEAMVPAHSKATEKIKELLPKLGKSRRATFSFCQYSSRYDKFKNGIVENAFKRELEGGSLMDIGIYPLHFMHMLFGKPTDVTGFTDIFENSIDAHGTVLLKYDGMIGEIIYSKIADGGLKSEIQGENGYIIIDRMSRPKVLELHMRSGETEVFDFSDDKEDLYYETARFVKQINGEKTEEFNKYTLQTIETADIIRNKLGITFKKG